MNLWIILAITWISVSVVIADSSWFVQDFSLEEGDSESAELFSSENLLRVKNKQASARKVTAPPVKVAAKTTTPKPQQDPVLSDVAAEGLLPANPTGRKPLQVKKKDVKMNLVSPTNDNTGKTNSKEWIIYDSAQESEGKDGLFPSELLIRVYPSKSKRGGPQTAGGVKQSPVTAKPVNVESKPNIANSADQHRPVQATRGRFLQLTQPLSAGGTPGEIASADFRLASPNLVAWFHFDKNENTISKKDDLSEGHYIRVQTVPKKPSKKQVETKQITQAITKTSAKPHQADKKPVETVEKPKAATAALKKNEYTPTETARRKPLQMAQGDASKHGKHTTSRPVEPCTDVDCLMKDDDLIPVHKKNPGKGQAVITETDRSKEREISRESLHRRLLQKGEETGRDRRDVEPAESEELMESEDTSEDLLWGEDTLLRRFRRAENETETEESGDGGFDGETVINNSSHTLDFQTTMNITKPEEGLTEELKEKIKMEFVNNSREKYQNFTGFQDVVVKNVSLDKNGRVVIDWELQLSTSAAPGSNPSERSQKTLDFITGTVVPYVNKELTVIGQPIYDPLLPEVVEKIAQNILDDPCKVKNACPEGYVCMTNASICRHACFVNSFYDQCRHGSTCQLNDEFQPYCQCGSGYMGTFCEDPVEESTYSNGQIVGAGAAGAVAAVGAAGCCVYFALYRKKKEEDMEYSYFGDDDAPMPAYSDPDSNLGISNNFSIARPSIIQPLDLYNDDGAMA